jgi:hypothetical protein
LARLLLAAGKKGKRYALPNARVMIHQPLIYGEGVSGQVTDIAIEAKELENTKIRLTEILAKHTGQPFDGCAPTASETFICLPRKPRNTVWWTKCSPSENKSMMNTTPTGKDGKEITQCVFCAKGKKEGCA